MTDAPFDAAIIGGGVAGTALTIALASRAPAGFAAVVFDRSDVGPGTAYTPQSATLLLNGPVRAMSISPGDERHFERWLVDEPGDALICRARYGSYARSSAAAALASRSDFAHIRDEVVDVWREPDDTYVLTTSSGERHRARQVIFALGNLPPCDRFFPEALRTSSGYFGDPWRVDVSPFEARDVALIGSRLTAMDVVALLDERAFRGRVHLISRHGLLPYVEDPRIRAADPNTLKLDPTTPYTLVKSMRRAAKRFDGDWRSVVDSIRARTPAIWSAWSLRDRKRFLRHAHSMWAIHRYRVPAATYAAFARLQAEGRIINHAGRISGVRIVGETIALTVSRGNVTRDVNAAYVINCSGPNANITTASHALIRAALERGLVRPDPLDLGMDASPDCRLLDSTGTAHRNLYGIGSVLRGVWYETTAVPEITKQAADISSALLAPPVDMMVAG